MDTRVSTRGSDRTDSIFQSNGSGVMVRVARQPYTIGCFRHGRRLAKATMASAVDFISRDTQRVDIQRQGSECFAFTREGSNVTITLWCYPATINTLRGVGADLLIFPKNEPTIFYQIILPIANQGGVRVCKFDLTAPDYYFTPVPLSLLPPPTKSAAQSRAG